MTFTSIKVMVHRHGYVTFTSQLERGVNTVNDFLKKTLLSYLMHSIQYENTYECAINGILIMLTSLSFLRKKLLYEIEL